MRGSTLVPLAAAVLSVATGAACGGAPARAPAPDGAPASYAFLPPSGARPCDGAAAPENAASCARYQELVRPAGDAPTSVEELDVLAALCRDGVLDACDLGLLVVAMCSEQEAPTGPACVHLARIGQLPPPEPTMRDAPVPAEHVGCFELLQAPGPHAALLAPGAVFCLSPDGLLAIRPAQGDADVVAGGRDGSIEALRTRALAARRLVREGLAVRELPVAEVDLIAREPPRGTSTDREGEPSGDHVSPVIATLLPGPRVRTAYAEMAARRLDAAELARRAPGLDRVPLDATCARARVCLEQRHAGDVALGEAAGAASDGAPPEPPTSLRACAQAAAACAR